MMWASNVNDISYQATNIVVFSEEQSILLKQKFQKNPSFFKNISKITIIGPNSKFKLNDFGENIDFTVIVGSLDPSSKLYSNDDFSEIVVGSYKYVPNWFLKYNKYSL